MPEITHSVYYHSHPNEKVVGVESWTIPNPLGSGNPRLYRLDGPAYITYYSNGSLASVKWNTDPNGIYCIRADGPFLTKYDKDDRIIEQKWSFIHNKGVATTEETEEYLLKNNLYWKPGMLQAITRKLIAHNFVYKLFIENELYILQSCDGIETSCDLTDALIQMESVCPVEYIQDIVI